MKKILKEYIPQVILIVFSVVLGLYFNQILVDRNENAKAKELMALVVEEINSNRALIAEWHPYHDSIKLNFQLLKNDANFIERFIEDKHTLVSTLFTRGKFMQQFPSTSAWEITKSNPLVSNINYENTKLITDIYNVQNNMFNPVFKMFDLHNTTGMNKEQLAKENLDIMYFHIKETVGRKLYYLELYDAALAKIKVDN